MFLGSRKWGNFQKQQNTSALPQMLLMVRGAYHIFEVLYHKIERSIKWHCVPVTQWHRRCPGVRAPSYTLILHTTCCLLSCGTTACYLQGWWGERPGVMRRKKDFRSRRARCEIITMAEFRPCNANIADPVNDPIRRLVPRGCGKWWTVRDWPQRLVAILAINMN